MSSNRLRLVLIGVLTTMGCSDEPAKVEPTLESIQTNIFDVHCAVSGCHAGSIPQSAMSLERGQSWEQLVGRSSAGMPKEIRVVPLQPDESYLMRKLTGERIVGERMPMGRAPLPDSLVAAIESWISSGALPE